MPKVQGDDGRDSTGASDAERRTCVRQLFRQFHAANRRAWFRDLRDDILAVRTPLLATAAYFVILFIPDQSADSIRTLFEESTGWLTAILIGWWLILVYLFSALMATVVLGFERADRLRGRAPVQETSSGIPRLSVQRWILLGAIVFAIPVITISSILSSHAPSVVLLSIPLSIVLLGLGLFIFCPLTALFMLDQKLSEGPLIGAGILCFSLLYLGHFFAIGDFPPLLMITIWIVVVLGVLEVIEQLSARWGVPIFAALLMCFLAFSVWTGTTIMKSGSWRSRRHRRRCKTFGLHSNSGYTRLSIRPSSPGS